MRTPHFAPRMALLATLLTLVVGCSKTTGIGGAAGDARPEKLKPTAQFAQELKLDDAQDFQDAKRGFIAKPTGQIKAADGTVEVWCESEDDIVLVSHANGAESYEFVQVKSENLSGLDGGKAVRRGAL